MDGPYVETKEWMAGCERPGCADLDVAIEIASKHPLPRFGQIEIWPVWPFTWRRLRTLLRESGNTQGPTAIAGRVVRTVGAWNEAADCLQKHPPMGSMAVVQPAGLP
ncbi:YciI family protein [Pseudarthrobacter sp. P1]|uniref:YciI family protein n=1 Tax=Pseudarthrobacter sp. P1 TaxID=3418418 RepID=UPI003CED6EA7